MSFSIFGKKEGNKKPSSTDQKASKDSLSTTTDFANPITPQHQTTDTDESIIKNTLDHHGAALENITALEEAAILFASNQVEVAELILQNLTQDENTTEPNSSAWLMLFDLYQITNNQTKFEQLRLEYATKWIEITPPNWKTPPTQPTSNTALSDVKQPDQLILPAIIEGDTQQLISVISEFAGQHNSVQLDCSQLDRIDFTSCGQLLSGLMPISATPNVSIEFHDVNHLVAALLNAMGFNSIALISPR
jgi:ABC-type transporter Mla MlaB component